MLIVKCIPRKGTDQLPDKHSFVNSFALLLTLTIYLSVSNWILVCLCSATLLFNFYLPYHSAWCSHTHPILQEALWLCPSLVNSIHHYFFCLFVLFFLHPALLDFHPILE